MPRFLRTCLPQSSSSARSSTLTFRVLGRSPAARTASFQRSKHRNIENAEIPERAMNSECEGARPSFLAILAMASIICFLSYMRVRATSMVRCRFMVGARHAVPVFFDGAQETKKGETVSRQFRPRHLLCGLWCSGLCALCVELFVLFGELPPDVVAATLRRYPRFGVRELLPLFFQPRLLLGAIPLAT